MWITLIFSLNYYKSIDTRCANKLVFNNKIYILHKKSLSFRINYIIRVVFGEKHKRI